MKLKVDDVFKTCTTPEILKLCEQLINIADRSQDQQARVLYTLTSMVGFILGNCASSQEHLTVGLELSNKTLQFAANDCYKQRDAQTTH